MANPYLPFAGDEYDYDASLAYGRYDADPGLVLSDDAAPDAYAAPGADLLTFDLPATAAESAKGKETPEPGKAGLAAAGSTTPQAPIESASTISDFHAAARAILEAPERQWNDEFQAALDLPHTVHEDAVARLQALQNLGRDMNNAAQILGTQIVLEMGLPADAKLIKPVDVGGVAGGEKFIAAGLFFKFASKDSAGLYGSDAAACIAAGHELKGAQAYTGLDLPSVRPPLLALVDVFGMRLLVSSVLPISSSTLQYGSADAGRTVQCDASIAQVMAEAGRALNLKPHVVGRTREVQTTLYGPCDIEVHKGRDGRTYVLDTARVMPPDFTALEGAKNVRSMLMPPHPASGMLPGMIPAKTWKVSVAQELAHLHNVPVGLAVEGGWRHANKGGDLSQGALLLHDAVIAGYRVHIASLNPRHPAVIASIGATDFSQRAWVSWQRRHRQFGHRSAAPSGAAAACSPGTAPAHTADDDVVAAVATAVGEQVSTGAHPAPDVDLELEQDSHGSGYNVFTGVTSEGRGVQRASVAAQQAERQTAALPAKRGHDDDEEAAAVAEAMEWSKTPSLIKSDEDGSQGVNLDVSSGLMLNHRITGITQGDVYGTALVLMPARGVHLHKLLRPELLAASTVPLSSDAFTGFGAHNAAEHNAEVAGASNFLQETIIPRLADELSVRALPSSTSQQLGQSMHRRGVNMRYLPAVLLHIKPTLYLLQTQLLTEMVVRFAKCDLRHRLRVAAESLAKQSASGAFLSAAQRSQALKEVVAEFLCCVFGMGESADIWWLVYMPLGLRQKFGDIQVQFSRNCSLISPEATVAYEVRTTQRLDWDCDEAEELDPATARRMAMQRYMRLLAGLTLEGDLVNVDMRRLRAVTIPQALMEEILFTTGVIMAPEKYAAFMASPTDFWRASPFSAADILAVQSQVTPLVMPSTMVATCGTASTAESSDSQAALTAAVTLALQRSQSRETAAPATPSQGASSPPTSSAGATSAARSGLLSTVLVPRGVGDLHAIFGKQSLQAACFTIVQAQEQLRAGRVKDARDLFDLAWPQVEVLVQAATVHTKEYQVSHVAALLHGVHSGTGAERAAADAATRRQASLYIGFGHMPSLQDAAIGLLFFRALLEEASGNLQEAYTVAESCLDLLSARYGSADLMVPVTVESSALREAGLHNVTPNLLYSVAFVRVERGSLFTMAVVEVMLRILILQGASSIDVKLQSAANLTVSAASMKQPPLDEDMYLRVFGTRFPLTLQFMALMREGKPSLKRMRVSEKREDFDFDPYIATMDSRTALAQDYGTNVWRDFSLAEQQAAMALQKEWWANEITRMQSLQAVLHDVALVDVAHIQSLLAADGADDDGPGSLGEGETAKASEKDEHTAESRGELRDLPMLDMWDPRFDFLRPPSCRGDAAQAQRLAAQEAERKGHSWQPGSVIDKDDMPRGTGWTGVPRGVYVRTHTKSAMVSVAGEHVSLSSTRAIVIGPRPLLARESVGLLSEHFSHPSQDMSVGTSTSASKYDMPADPPGKYEVLRHATLYYDESTGWVGTIQQREAGVITSYTEEPVPFSPTHYIPVVAMAGLSSLKTEAAGGYRNRTDMDQMLMVAAGPLWGCCGLPLMAGSDLMSETVADAATMTAGSASAEALVTSNKTTMTLNLAPVVKQVMDKRGPGPHTMVDITGFRMFMVIMSSMTRIPSLCTTMSSYELPGGQLGLRNSTAFAETSRSVTESDAVEVGECSDEEIEAISSRVVKLPGSG